METKLKAAIPTLSTKSGALRLLTLFIALIFICSFIAQLISTNGGKVKMVEVTIDGRGAALNGELYYPAGASDQTKLPAVIVIHGGGCNNVVVRGWAEELAKRGFVALNLSAYGTGLSENPVSNENGQGVKSYSIMATPMGALDAENFIRGMAMVDPTRTAIVGHSQGSRRGGYAAFMDCGYFSHNDIMINFMYDTFGQKFTAADLGTNADTLAKQRLTEDQLKYYNQMKAINTADFNKKIKALCLVGSTGQYCIPNKSVQVGGVTVTRNLQCNQYLINGLYDPTYNTFINDKVTKTAWYQTSIQTDTWYALNDVAKTSTAIGKFPTISSATNKALADAINARTLRMTSHVPMTHSKEFFSPLVASMIVNYITEVLNYSITPGGVTAADTSSFIWRQIFNLVAMLAMVGAFFPLIKLFVLSKKFAGCASEERITAKQNKSKLWLNLIVLVLTIALGYIAIYATNNNKLIPGTFWNSIFKTNSTWPLFMTAWTPYKLLTYLIIGGLLTTAIYALLSKNLKGFWEYVKSNFNFGILNIFKSILIGFALVLFGFVAFSAMWYLFQQDFQLWMLTFTEIKADLALLALQYALVALPFYVILSLFLNYLSESTLGSGVIETIITVVLNTAGIALCAIVNYYIAVNSAFGAPLYCSFITTYGVLLFVPLSTYILRKSYRMTKNVWVGAVVVSLLLGWFLCCYSGSNSSYSPQSALSNFLGL